LGTPPKRATSNFLKLELQSQYPIS